MKNLLVLSVAFMAIFFFPVMGKAQTTQEERRIEEATRKALERTELEILEGEARLLVDYGGWVYCSYEDYHDDDNDSTAEDYYDKTYSVDYRFWLKATLRPPANASYTNQHSFYTRLKDLHKEKAPDETAGGYEHDGPDVDYAYLSLDFRPCWLGIGRRYYSIGQGISYSDVNDGIELVVPRQRWNFKALASHSLPDEDNIDTSAPGWEEGSDRTYYGLEATFLAIPNQSIYSYLLVQRDDSDEEPDDPDHDYTYDSEYIGLGMRGKILPRMHYWGEVIRQTGESRVYDTNEKVSIDAWGGDFGVSYDWEVYSHPNFSIEYAFGSGDPDRVSVTNTEYGNTSGDDENFLYFGYLPSGYALSPRLSNIHFYNAGVLLKPLEKYRFFRNLSLGVDYYRYYKDKDDGGIYDSDASESDDDIGSEIDVTISWQILSDLRCFLEYGHFEPGSAYPDSTSDGEDYLFAGMMLTF